MTEKKHYSHLLGTPAPTTEDLLRQQVEKLRNIADKRDREIKQLKEALALKDREVDSLSRALNASANAERGTAFRPTHRHVKRGSEYREVARGKLQTDVPLNDYADLVAYHDADGVWWFRSPAEFDDGRFDRIGESS